jgi:hypothetical protein
LEFLLDAALGRLSVAQINDAFVGDAGVAEMLDKLLVAAVFHAGGEGTPDVSMLPLEQADDEDAGAFGIPIELGFCVARYGGQRDDGKCGEQATSVVH